MRAKEIMTTPVITVPPDMPVEKVAETLWKNGISAAPVIDGGVLVGIVSEADVMPFEAEPSIAHPLPVPKTGRAAAKTASDLMTPNVVTLSPDAEISGIAWIMVDRHLKTTPIVSDGRVVGIVSRRDLIRVLVRDDADL